MYFNTHGLARLALILSSLSISSLALAQAGAGAALKNSQDNITSLPKPPTAPQLVAPVDLSDNAIYLVKLNAVDVKGETLKEEVIQYFAPFIGKSLTNSDLKKFKEWAWNTINQRGLLGSVEVTKSTVEGVLIIEVMLPKVGNKVVTGPEALVARYQKKVLSEFAGVKPNSVVDTLDLDQHMYNLNQVLPIDVNVTVQPQANNQIDLIFNISEKNSELGKFKYGAVQLNDYGLSQFGRVQGLVALNFEGFTTGSLANVTLQGTQGLLYAHTDYSAPNQFLNGALRIWLEGNDTKNITSSSAATKGKTSVFGLGTSSILGSNRATLFQLETQATKSNTKNTVIKTDTVTSDVSDKQARIKLSADNSALAKDDLFHADTSVVYGTDENGQYTFLTSALSFQKSLLNNGITLVAKANGQALPNRNLDSYNRISIGGVNGVRAYSTLDGVGDTGAFGSLELRKVINGSGDYLAAFYDGGVVKENLNGVAKQYNQAYSLQALGMAASGSFKLGGAGNQILLINASLAKGVGGYAAFVPGIYESTPNSWRFNVAMTLPLQ